MLSAREFATLMLTRDAADRIGDRRELDLLLERQLDAFERLVDGVSRPGDTDETDPLLRAIRRFH